MKNLYVVCNDFDENEECVCCICGSEKKAEEKIEEYENNFLKYSDYVPNFWIKKIPAMMNASDCFEFE